MLTVRDHPAASRSFSPRTFATRQITRFFRSRAFNSQRGYKTARPSFRKEGPISIMRQLRNMLQADLSSTALVDLLGRKKQG